MIKSFANFINSLRRHYLTRLLLLSAMVGIAAALGALVFTYVIDLATHAFMGGMVGYMMPLPGAEGPTVIARTSDISLAVSCRPRAGRIVDRLDDLLAGTGCGRSRYGRRREGLPLSRR